MHYQDIFTNLSQVGQPTSSVSAEYTNTDGGAVVQ